MKKFIVLGLLIPMLIHSTPVLITRPEIQAQLRSLKDNEKFLNDPDFNYLLTHGECPPDKHCNFDGINLENIWLSPKTNFRNVSLKNANLRGMYAEGVDFTGAQFDNSLMNGCSMRGVICNDASFKGAKLFTLYAPNSQFRKADFTNANLYHAAFYDDQLINNISIPSDLQEVVFDNTIIQFTQLANTNMANAKGIGVTISANGTASLAYPANLYQDSTSGISTAVFCSTLMPVIGTKKNIVVSLKDSFAGGSWCNCNSFLGYSFTITTGNQTMTIKSNPFGVSGVNPQYVTNMGCM